jgi:hypothetical protein
MSGPSAARPIAPWCAVYSFGRGDVVSYCQYSSFEQCRPFVGAGSGGTCNINPAWPGSWQSAYYAGKPNKHAARRR